MHASVACRPPPEHAFIHPGEPLEVPRGSPGDPLEDSREISPPQRAPIGESPWLLLVPACFSKLTNRICGEDPPFYLLSRADLPS